MIDRMNLFLVKPFICLCLFSITVNSQSSNVAEIEYSGTKYVEEGNSFTIICYIESLKNLKWIKDSAEIQPHLVESHSKYILKEETPADLPHNKRKASLVVLNADLSHAGKYKCNNFSDDFHQLGVISGIITNEEEKGNGLILEVGKQFFIICNVSSDQPLSVKWMKNGQDITAENRTFTIHEQNNTLEIRHARDDDWGIYRCEVNASDVNISAAIVVRTKPRVEQLGSSYNHVQGDKFTLSCTVHGNPVPVITWFKDDVNITEDNARIKIELSDDNRTSKLIIDQLEEDDRALYKCVAESEVGRDDTVTQLRVKDKLAALWPFLGIVAEVAVLCTIIFIYEKRRLRQDFEESDTDQSPDTKNVTENKDKDIRQRK